MGITGVSPPVGGVELCGAWEGSEGGWRALCACVEVKAHLDNLNASERVERDTDHEISALIHTPPSASAYGLAKAGLVGVERAATLVE